MLLPSRFRHICKALLFGCGLFLTFGIAAANATLPAPAPNCEETKRIIRGGVDWLIRGQQSTGLFTYDRFTQEKADRETQNMTRQIGTLWSMTRSLEVLDRPEVRRSIDRARAAIAGFVETNHSPDGDVAFIEEMEIAKLNAAALYLLTLTELQQKAFSLTVDEQRHLPMLAAGLRQMREDSGGFRYLYFMPRQENRITTYGSAEAVLALAAYAEHEGDAQLKDYALDSFNRYYKSYLAEAEGFGSTDLRGYFSWALQAQMLLQDDLESSYHGPIRAMVEKALTYRSNNAACATAGCIVVNATTSAGHAVRSSSMLPCRGRIGSSCVATATSPAPRSSANAQRNKRLTASNFPSDSALPLTVSNST